MNEKKILIMYGELYNDEYTKKNEIWIFNGNFNEIPNDYFDIIIDITREYDIFKQTFLKYICNQSVNDNFLKSLKKMFQTIFKKLKIDGIFYYNFDHLFFKKYILKNLPEKKIHNNEEINNAIIFNNFLFEKKYSIGNFEMTKILFPICIQELNLNLKDHYFVEIKPRYKKYKIINNKKQILILCHTPCDEIKTNENNIYSFIDT